MNGHRHHAKTTTRPAASVIHCLVPIIIYNMCLFIIIIFYSLKILDPNNQFRHSCQCCSNTIINMKFAAGRLKCCLVISEMFTTLTFTIIIPYDVHTPLRIKKNLYFFSCPKPSIYYRYHFSSQMSTRRSKLYEKSYKCHNERLLLFVHWCLYR